MRTRLQHPVTWAALLILALCGQSALAGPAEGAISDPRRVLATGAWWLILALLALIMKATIIAFAYCAAELKPALFRKGRDIFLASPVKSFFVGLLHVVVVLIIGLWLANKKPAAVLGLIVLLIWVVVVISSKALIYQLLGMKIVGEVSEPEGSPSPRAHCWGGVTAELAFLTPVIGWLADVILTFMVVGALVLAAIRHERPAAKAK